MQIESIKIKNYKALQDVCIENITPMTVIIGENGVGKSTFFDVFRFLQDCLNTNVKTALDKRGGFKEVVSRGRADEEIGFELKFRLEKNTVTIIYKLYISNVGGRPTVAKEYLGSEFSQKIEGFLFEFTKGVGKVLDLLDLKPYNLDSPDVLAIKGLGQFKSVNLPGIAECRKMIEGWTISDFRISSASNLQDNVASEHLSVNGENLSQAAKYLYENHKPTFNKILEKMKKRIPGVVDVQAEPTIDDRLVLRFKDGAFKDPFLSKYASDGTMKMFAYLVLLADPSPSPLLCIEEPENQLYPQILGTLAEEFREYSDKGQIFVSTHSPDFLNSVELNELILFKKKDGYTTAKRLSEDATIGAMIDYGDKLGWLWKQGLLDGGK